MRDCSNHRAGFDCVLMAVAATFLTVSPLRCPRPRHWRRPIRPATAQPNLRSTPRFRAPNPPMFRLRRSTISSRTSSSPTPPRPHPRRQRQRRKPRRPSPRTSLPRRPPIPASRRPPRSKPAGPSPARASPPRTTPPKTIRPPPRPPRLQPPLPQRRPPSRPRSRPRNRQRRQQCGAGRPAGGRPAARHRGGEILALFRPQGRADCGGKILRRARLCPVMDAGRRADRDRKRRHRASQGCRLRRLERRRLSGAGFQRRYRRRTRLQKPI